MAKNKKTTSAFLRLSLVLFFLFSTFIIIPVAMERHSNFRFGKNHSYRTAGSNERSVPSYARDEILVRFKPSVSTVNRKGLISMKGHKVKRTISGTDLSLVKIKDGESVEETLEQYRNMAGVEHVQPNYRYHVTALPNDADYDQLWGLKNTGQEISDESYAGNNPGLAGMDMDLETAWDYITDCSSVIVAVIDTGVNYTHKDLAANMWDGGPAYPNHGYDFVPENGDNDPMDLDGHGTHVAGTIGAVGNNSKGTCGVCWKVQIMAIRVIDETGVGYGSDIIQGIHFAVDHGATIINMSLGGSDYDEGVSDAISYAQENDVLVVVAAGNETIDNESVPTYPCNFTQDNIVCVAALDQSYELAGFSNYGNISVDLGAPGTTIRSEWPGPVIKEDFGHGTLDWNQSGSAWNYFFYDYPPFEFDLLFALNIPDTHDAWQTYDLSGPYSYANLEFSFEAYMDGDSLGVYYNNDGGNPADNGTLLAEFPSGYMGPGYALLDISNCRTDNCSIGFRYSNNGDGSPPIPDTIYVFLYSITRIENGSASYNVIFGTSMSTPHVAGVAALIRAFNPGYTYAETAGSIINGGDVAASLQDITVSGKAADAWGSLKYINPPTGISAEPL